MALRGADQSAYSDRIVGLILDAPVMDWLTTLTASAGASGPPGSITALGLRLLQSPTMRWVTGLQDPIEFKHMDWLKRADEIKKPILVLRPAARPS